jgi:acetyl-CoA carboxylase biotin carboxyl carrier protein
MSLKEIKDLIQVMNEHELVELEIEREGFKVRLVKKGHGKIVQQVVETSQNTPSVEVNAGDVQRGTESPLPANAVTIKAPMVGTFYITPSPDAAPFVEVGSAIEEGQVICIIEAMKLMNEIKSEVKGKVLKIFAQGGQPIEFGQSLFLIEKSG